MHLSQPAEPLRSSLRGLVHFDLSIPAPRSPLPTHPSRSCFHAMPPFHSRRTQRETGISQRGAAPQHRDRVTNTLVLSHATVSSAAKERHDRTCISNPWVPPYLQHSYLTKNLFLSRQPFFVNFSCCSPPSAQRWMYAVRIFFSHVFLSETRQPLALRPLFFFFSLSTVSGI